VSSLPPRGAGGVGPSTYLIDVAEEGAAIRASEQGDERPFTAGNVTRLRVRSERVTACLDFAEDEPGEAMPLADFLAILGVWRVRVLDGASASTSALPETYRRNPARWVPSGYRRRRRAPGGRMPAEVQGSPLVGTLVSLTSWPGRAA
jgi:hypothetical protein